VPLLVGGSLRTFEDERKKIVDADP